MNVQTLDKSLRHHRGGQVSYLLLTKGQFGSERLSITWVDGQPGSQQALHAHPAQEQVFVIVQGWGLMLVDGEEREVTPGTLIFIPPGATHAIRNIGREPLTFVSATVPPFEEALVRTQWTRDPRLSPTEAG